MISALAEPIEIIEKKQKTGVNISAKNLTNWPITLRLTAELSNLRSNLPLPLSMVVPPNSTRSLVKFRAPNSEAWKYSYNYDWRHGDYRVRPTNNTRYRLPFDGKYKVIQGANGAFSHTGELANSIDFGLPTGTPVLAAREGYVVEAIEHFTEGGPDRALFLKANRVLIAHQDGTIAEYFHFRPEGVAVEEGQRVTAGELLGYSGNTGFSDGPHLHIGLFKPSRDAKTRVSLPMEFRHSEGSGPAVEGRSYSHR